MNTQDGVNPNELISALADGELRAEDFSRAMALMETSSQARACWQISHLVGDVLRAPELAQTAAGDVDFVLRLRQRLVDEAPMASVPSSGRALEAGSPKMPAANEARMRWKMVAGVASLAVFLGAGWHLVGGKGMDRSELQLAIRGAGAGQAVMLRDPRLDELLAAHQQLGGVSALQKPAGFLRGATYERPLR